VARKTRGGSPPLDQDDPRRFVEDALAYAKRTAGDPASASIHARAACERFIRDHTEAQKDSKWRFDDLAAVKAMLFAQQMPNIKGPEANKPVRLMDWQKFAFANIFGFKEAGTETRRFRQGGIFVPKGNGKTTISAPLAMYMTFGEGEGGAEGYAAAVTRDQARILFDTAQNMVRRSPDMQREWRVGVLTNSIFQEHTASRFIPISSDAKALDGLNVAVAVCDEIGSHRTSEVYDALITAMGKRRQPFLLSISTATSNSAGIGKQVWDYVMRVVQGGQDDDRLFGIIYSIDDQDDPWEEATWIKANPGWGRSVQPDAIRAIMRQARNNPSQEASARTRHLNVWVGADEALFSTRAWNACGDPALHISAFEGRECYIGVDLASRADLAAVVSVFPQQVTVDGVPSLQFTVFSRCYLNEAAVMEARNPSYPGWAANNELIITPGNETDFNTIESDILDMCKRFHVVSLAFDPYNSVHLAQRLTTQGVPCVEFRSNTLNFSPATRELEAAIRGGRIQHDMNGPLAWCIGNVVGHTDARDNVYPRKARPENKIDAAIALIMAIARATTHVGTTSIYESRGLLTLG
jgi:phage terminase large subunit-like protein